MALSLVLMGTMTGSIAQHQAMKEQNKIAKENLEFQKQSYADKKAQVDKYEDRTRRTKSENDAMVSNA